MTQEAVEALRTEHDTILAAAESWAPDQWEAPSACAGWRVQDLMVHMATVLQQVVDPSTLPPVDQSLPFERQLDQMVDALRELTPDEALSRYRDVGKRAIDALEGLQAMDSPIDLGELGTFPLHMLANAYAFDAYTHMRADLLKPRGPIDGEVPPATDGQLNASMDWMFTGMPTMSRATLEPIKETVNMSIDGPGARTVNVTAGSVEEGSSPDAAATITSTAPDFVLWATKRESPDGRVRIEGDQEVGKRFAEALNIF